MKRRLIWVFILVILTGFMFFEETEIEEDAFGENVIRKSRKVEK